MDRLGGAQTRVDQVGSCLAKPTGSESPFFRRESGGNFAHLGDVMERFLRDAT